MTRHGRPYDRCGYCGRWVRMSGFFAGIHVCVDEDTIARIDRQRALMRQAQADQLRASRRPLPSALTKGANPAGLS